MVSREEEKEEEGFKSQDKWKKKDKPFPWLEEKERKIPRRVLVVPCTHCSHTQQLNLRNGKMPAGGGGRETIIKEMKTTIRAHKTALSVRFKIFFFQKTQIGTIFRKPFCLSSV